MNINASIGIARGFTAQQKVQLRQIVRERMPDMNIYSGHTYSDFFSLGNHDICMWLREDGDVELQLTTDSSKYFPL